MTMKKTDNTALIDGRQKLDFRNDGLLPPTEAMWRAMKEASLNLEMAFSRVDPTISRLEEICARLTGQEDAYMLPSATAATVISLLAWDRKGELLVTESRSHLYWMQHFHYSVYGQMSVLPIEGDKFGVMDLAHIQKEVSKSAYNIKLKTGVISVENTHTVCGGTVLTVDYMKRLRQLADSLSAKVFLDGARIFDAAVAQGVPVSALSSDADAVVFSLNKGPRAPYGAMLCGSAEFIEKTRVEAERLGVNQVHKGGIFAGAALVGLTDNLETRLKTNHQMAYLLASKLSEIPGISVDLETVQTNLVRASVRDTGLSAVDFAEQLAARGLGVRIVGSDAIRLVTHEGISEADVDEAVDIVRQVVASL